MLHLQCQTCLFQEKCNELGLFEFAHNDKRKFVRDPISLESGGYLEISRDSSISFYILRSGIVKSVTCLGARKSFSVGYFSKGDVFGVSMYSPYVKALKTSKACRFSLNEDLWGEDMKSTLATLKKIAKDESFAIERRIVLLQKTKPSSRVAGFILDEASKKNNLLGPLGGFKLPFTVAEIGEYLGLVRETVSRELSRMNRLTLIDYKDQEIKIKNTEGLLQLLQSER